MIRLNKLKFDYPEMPMAFDLHINQQERVAIVGPSGAGKSTLLNLIAGFEFADSGDIWLNNEKHTQTAPHLRPVSMLFQENNLFTHLNVQQNIALGLKPNLKLDGAELRQVEEVANAVGLKELLFRLPTELSGGQKQRVALARCLLRDKPILLLDEPFSALDPALRLEMLNLLQQLWLEKQLTVVIVTHQPNELIGRVDRIIKIEQGQAMGLDSEDAV
ncbi:thiamine ABC transporter ATP-binding protein [Conservatibacter flavescens]|uniref:Thiamine ABC transporter ATP-binding protein n=1 Tax=Conservatibacter flavescens TaxID=28161 RepID=A0A2M8S3X3_9PAST|nr:thiamine ABC transporter ATP-binding protein [Conservatibacter flavescens]PJG85844.1 thiamine ABC transporter ATP-binding protein [Conservatibacter flavescens]